MSALTSSKLMMIMIMMIILFSDLAIGAATSATVYLYRCIPTVLVHTSIKVPDAMNLPHNATGFTALFCVTLPKKPLWSHVTIGKIFGKFTVMS